MKSVLISIKPKWCELIACGKKTVEVRKTKPKLETPFKVYIYCTKDKTPDDILTFAEYDRGKYIGAYLANGAVIGEFVCDRISGGDGEYAVYHTAGTCLTPTEIADYIEDKYAYFWHISNLVIYDKPRELNEFKKPCTHKNDCCTCDRYDYIGHRCYDDITRPFQSWGYVESEEQK